MPLLLRTFSRTGTPIGVQILFLMFIVVLFAIPAIMGNVNVMADREWKGITVEASPTGLVIERQGVWPTRTTVISAADILDLDYGTIEGELEAARRSASMTAFSGITATRLFASLQKLVPTRGIIVKTGEELITLGEGLPAGELQYLIFV